MAMATNGEKNTLFIANTDRLGRSMELPTLPPEYGAYYVDMGMINYH